MTEVKWTERAVMAQLLRHFDPARNLVLNNYTNGLLGFEADMVVVRPSGWAEEIEIKVSKADFKAEFQKSLKHRMLVQGDPGLVKRPWRGIGMEENDKRWAELIEKPGADIIKFNGAPSHIRDWERAKKHRCRRYWFAMPSELANACLDSIPEYAGLISVGPRRVLKPAPALPMARKLNPEERHHILMCCYHRYWWKVFTH